MENNIQTQKKEYLKNKKKYNRSVEKQMGIQITQSEFIENNEVFNQLVLNLPLLKNEIKTEYSDIHSLVQIDINNKYKLKYHNCITFFLPDGSHLRFSPYKKGLELSRLYVLPENQGSGIGTHLMEVFFTYLDKTLDERPEIIVEITGAVGYGKNLLTSDIKKQLQFYQKFGFEILNSRKYYITLVRPFAQKLEVP